MENKQEVESPAPLAWRPEVGKTAWKFTGDRKYLVECNVIWYEDSEGVDLWQVMQDGGFHTLDNFFPTAEAALASIKVYDLNGVEVPRDQPVIPVHVQGYCKGCGEKLEYDGDVLSALQNLANAAYNMNLADNAGEKPTKEGQAMDARSLSGVYAGVLSRNWPKMLEALESGESRVLIYSYDLPLDNGKSMVVQGIIECHCFIYDGKTVSYQNIVGCDFFGTMRSEALDRLESRGMGFFPANDSEK